MNEEVFQLGELFMGRLWKKEEASDAQGARVLLWRERSQHEKLSRFLDSSDLQPFNSQTAAAPSIGEERNDRIWPRNNLPSKEWRIGPSAPGRFSFWGILEPEVADE